MTPLVPSGALIPRAQLFGSPARVSTQISPDGRWLTWLAPVEGVLNIWLCPIDARDQARSVTADRARGIRQYGWTYDGRHLVYLQDNAGDENFHVFALDPWRHVTRDLTPFDGVRASVAGSSRILRDHLLVSLNLRDRKFFDLHKVHLSTGELTLVAQNPGFAAVLADESFRVQFAVKREADGTQQILRHSPDGTWSDWLRIAPEDARTSGLQGLNAAGSALFLRDSRGRDTAALTRIDLATGELRVLAADPRADITDMIVDVDTKEPVAVSVEGERRGYVAIDHRIQPDLDFLAAQDIGDWYLSSRSEDDRLWVVSFVSDSRIPAAYLYDRRSRSLEKLHDSRPELAAASLAPMRPVTIRARDGLPLVCYLTLPPDARGPGPLVVQVHGGPWARDSFGFSISHQWLANRGYAVLSVNFRGSAGFGKAFINAGDGEWGRRMDDDLLDAVAWCVSENVTEPGRVGIMGLSYGGYAVLAGMTRNPETYACGVDIVGPSNLETLIATIPPYWEAIRSWFTRAIGDPATAEGRALLRDRSPLFRAERIARPLLIAQGANDPRVKQAESDQMVAALQAHAIPVTYLLYPDEGHGLARPANSISCSAIVEMFLARHLGGHMEPITADELTASTVQVVAGAAELDLPG